MQTTTLIINGEFTPIFPKVIPATYYYYNVCKYQKETPFHRLYKEFYEIPEEKRQTLKILTDDEFASLPKEEQRYYQLYRFVCIDLKPCTHTSSNPCGVFMKIATTAYQEARGSITKFLGMITSARYYTPLSTFTAGYNASLYASLCNVDLEKYLNSLKSNPDIIKAQTVCEAEIQSIDQKIQKMKELVHCEELSDYELLEYLISKELSFKPNLHVLLHAENLYMQYVTEKSKLTGTIEKEEIHLTQDYARSLDHIKEQRDKANHIIAHTHNQQKKRQAQSLLPSFDKSEAELNEKYQRDSQKLAKDKLKCENYLKQFTKILENLRAELREEYESRGLAYLLNEFLVSRACKQSSLNSLLNITRNVPITMNTTDDIYYISLI